MTCRFTIYCHTNKVNGKRYVGQTVCSMEKRWSEHVTHSKAGSGCRKYGESTARGWANMSPEARTERVRKTQDDRRKVREARSSRLVRINLLPAEGAMA
jgi:hypothetical protein